MLRKWNPRGSPYLVLKDDSIMVTPFHMSPMLIIKRKMNTIKQRDKGDNAHQKLLPINSQFF
jgi:hypothetical protein